MRKSKKDVIMFRKQKWKDFKMFEIDKKRIEACIEYKDYYSALEYSILVQDKYKNKEKNFFERIIKSVKSGEYYKI